MHLPFEVLRPSKQKQPEDLGGIKMPRRRKRAAAVSSFYAFKKWEKQEILMLEQQRKPRKSKGPNLLRKKLLARCVFVFFFVPFHKLFGKLRGSQVENNIEVTRPTVFPTFLNKPRWRRQKDRFAWRWKILKSSYSWWLETCQCGIAS